jgi:phage I-like protein
MSAAATMEQALLSMPSLLSVTATGDTRDGRRSWIQLAKTGTFHSVRYGAFRIAKDDLAQMLRNFREVTPQAPTELPVDFDHLSMDPKKPGDGIAAGWMKQLELRQDGNELWGLIEWTPEAARRIADKEYRFVSPSFMKDYVSKAGQKVGTTLLAAAITNHPFLEGMQAVTLRSSMGDLAVTDLSDGMSPTHEVQNMTREHINALAAQFERRVLALSKNHEGHAAIRMATTHDPDGAEAYRLAGIGARRTEIESVESLSESLDQVAQRYATENQVSLREAVHAVGKARPDLVAVR